METEVFARIKLNRLEEKFSNKDIDSKRCYKKFLK